MNQLNSINNLNGTLSALYLFHFLYKNNYVKSSTLKLDDIEEEANNKLRRKITFFLKSKIEKIIEDNNLSDLFVETSISYNNLIFKSIDHAQNNYYSRYNRNNHRWNSTDRNPHDIAGKIRIACIESIQDEFLGDDSVFDFNTNSGSRRNQSWEGQLGIVLSLSTNKRVDERKLQSMVNAKVGEIAHEKNIDPTEVEVPEIVDTIVFENISDEYKALLNCDTVILELFKRIKYFYSKFLTYNNASFVLNENVPITINDISYLNDSLFDINRVRHYAQRNPAMVERSRIFERFISIVNRANDMRKNNLLTDEMKNTEYNHGSYIFHDIIAAGNLASIGYENLGIYQDIPVRISEMNELFLNAMEQV